MYANGCNGCIPANITDVHEIDDLDEGQMWLSGTSWR